MGSKIAMYLKYFMIFFDLMQIFFKLAFGKETLSGKDYLYSAVISFGPIMLLMARSFGTINFWTIGLITLFLILASFLVAKRT